MSLLKYCLLVNVYSKTCVKRPLSKRPKLVFKTNYCLMQVKSIAECSKDSAILLTFIKLPVVIKIFVLSIFEWLFYTGLTVLIRYASIKSSDKTVHMQIPRAFIAHTYKVFNKMKAQSNNYISSTNKRIPVFRVTT